MPTYIYDVMYVRTYMLLCAYVRMTTHMYPPPHTTHMYPPPHTTHMYPPFSYDTHVSSSLYAYACMMTHTKTKVLKSFRPLERRFRPLEKGFRPLEKGFRRMRIRTPIQEDSKCDIQGDILDGIMIPNRGQCGEREGVTLIFFYFLVQKLL